MTEIKLSSNTIPNNHLDELAEWIKTNPRLTKDKLTIEFEEKFAKFINTQIVFLLIVVHLLIY